MANPDWKLNGSQQKTAKCRQKWKGMPQTNPSRYKNNYVLTLVTSANILLQWKVSRRLAVDRSIERMSDNRKQ